MSKTQHGANLFELSKTHGFEISEIMDFSSNINPFGASEKALSLLRNRPNLISIYPDPAYEGLKEAIAEYTGAPAGHILPGSGATNLIAGFIGAVSPRNALLQKPAYSEYEKELQKSGAAIHSYFLSESESFIPSPKEILRLAKEKNCELIVLCNPNNPTGSILSREQIREILRKTDAYLMVDETYVEFTDTVKYSSASLVSEFPKLFVIRSTSKFFAAPGMRLGYGLSSDPKVHRAFDETGLLWGINIFADAAGSAMLRDRDYHKKTFELIAAQRSYLMNSLSSFQDLRVYPSDGNFILCRIASERFTAKDLYEHLLPRRIIIRNCTSFEGLSEYFFRVCTLRPDENKLLIQEISDFISSL